MIELPLAAGTAAKGALTLVAAIVVAGTFLLRAPRARAFAAVLALGLAPVLVVVELWDSSQIRSLRDNPSRAAIAAVRPRWPCWRSPRCSGAARACCRCSR